MDAPMETTTQRGRPKTVCVPTSPNHPQYHGTAMAKAMRYVTTSGQRGFSMPALLHRHYGVVAFTFAEEKMFTEEKFIGGDSALEVGLALVV